MPVSEVKRPILRYHGGKFILADWIISHFPDHKIYTESFGGAASVLLKKKRSYSEVYNDLDGDVVNLFRVCQSDPKKLVEAIYYTPFSREVFDKSYEQTEDSFERAVKTVVRAFQGFGSNSVSARKTGFRSNSNRSHTTPAHDWANFPKALETVIERLRGVVIEHRDYKKVLTCHDGPQTLHFLDPPYVLKTRWMGEKTKCYRFEMSDNEHEQLCEFIQTLEGMVVLCGYENDIYNTLLKGWEKSYKKSFADGARARTEVLWLSPNIQQTLTLF